MDLPRYNTILIIGPTGSGKTPLGNMCQQSGLWGKRCFHFDFGAHLREVSMDLEMKSNMTADEINVIIRSLKTGALLENENFHIAQKMLFSFLEKKRVNPYDLLILNGLPRHIGQAKYMDPFIDVEMVVYLHCKPEDIYKRIQLNSGGDRLDRIDDSAKEIVKKINIFISETICLLEYYQSKKIPVHMFRVGVDTSSHEIYKWLLTKK